MRKHTEMVEYAEIILSVSFLEFPHFFRMLPLFSAISLIQYAGHHGYLYRKNCTFAA